MLRQWLSWTEKPVATELAAFGTWFASSSDSKGSQKMKPSVMAPFQAFMAMAGHWIFLEGKQGIPGCGCAQRQAVPTRQLMTCWSQMSGGLCTAPAWVPPQLPWEWDLLKATLDGAEWLLLSKSYRLSGTSGVCSAQSSPLRQDWPRLNYSRQTFA